MIIGWHSITDCGKEPDTNGVGPMTKMFKALLTVLGFFSLSSALVLGAEEARDYLSNDMNFCARIAAVRKLPKQSLESKIQFLDQRGKVLLERDYSSQSGEHGLVIEQASWTPDSKYFVFSTSSSGGHQPWQSLLFVYRCSDNVLLDVQDFLPPVVYSNFTLSEPDFITLIIWTPFEAPKGIDRSIKLPITFRLRDLRK
jgi:hypothetical protein